MITREFLQALTWKPFDRMMWEGFAGCNSPVPFYAETSEDILVVLDGNFCEVFNADGEVLASCEDVTQLPYDEEIA